MKGEERVAVPGWLGRLSRPMTLFIGGLVLQTATLVPWLVVASLTQGSRAAVLLTALTILMHTIAFGCLVVATGLGIRGLARRTTPKTQQILAALSIPIAAVLLVPILIILFIATT